MARIIESKLLITVSKIVRSENGEVSAISPEETKTISDVLTEVFEADGSRVVEVEVQDDQQAFALAATSTGWAEGEDIRETSLRSEVTPEDTSKKNRKRNTQDTPPSDND